jgi:hypothetical protein
LDEEWNCERKEFVMYLVPREMQKELAMILQEIVDSLITK